jgi:hypothetical protein
VTVVQRLSVVPMLLDEEMLELFEHLARELPLGTAPFSSREIPNIGVMYIELKPTNPEAAAFGVYCDRGNVHSFSLGRSGLSQWEFP